MLVIVDIETTGLNPVRDEILEVAMIAVRDDLSLIADMPTVLVASSINGRLRMDETVMRMHTDSGLLKANVTSSLDINVANEIIVAWLQHHVPYQQVPMCGNSVHFDRMFLRHHMPDVENHFHYRNLDVSSIRECARRWTPNVNEGETTPTANHRALSDCHDSLALLRFYKSRIFEVANEQRTR